MVNDPILFLDIDGVLNGHKFMREAGSCNVLNSCVRELNRIVRRTGCKIVLSSAWRYMITGGAMTLDGFGYMLRTHGMIGAVSNGVLIGWTEPDEVCPACTHRHSGRRGNKNDIDNDGNRCCRKCGTASTRGRQVTAWLARNAPNAKRYVVLDDCELGFAEERHPFVQTRADRGLTRRKADEVIAMLTHRPGRVTARRRRAAAAE